MTDVRAAVSLAGGQPSPQPANRLARLRRSSRLTRGTVILLAPLLVYMLFVFAVPVGYQVAFAFYSRELYKGVMWLPVPDFTLVNFGRVFTEPEYLNSLVWTIGVALFTSTISVSLALPIAYFLARYKAFGKNLIELSFLLPIFGEIFTLYALAYALTPQGPLNWLLMTLGLIREPLQLTRNPASVILWMSIPTLSVLLIRGAIAGVDVMYEEAAQTMGANSWGTFWRITFPLAKKGITGTLLLSISGAVGTFTLPLVLVGPNNNWLATRIQREVNPFYNYPMASALGVVLTAISAFLLFLYLRNQEPAAQR